MAHIIVNDDTPKIQYTAAASDTVFTVPWPFFTEASLDVYQTLSGAVASDSADLLTLNTDYTVVGEGNVEGVLKTVTLVVAASAGDIITIIRNEPCARTTDFQTAGDFLAETMNDEQDKEVMLIQQLKEEQTRTIRGQISDPLPLSLLPSAPDRAGKILQFDINGDVAVVDSNSLIVAVPEEMAVLNTIATLQANTSATFTVAEVQGYYAQGDGGGGKFWLDTGDTSTADDGGINIVDSQSTRTGTWKRIYSGAINIRWFGAKGDGSTDDTAAIVSSLSAGTGGGVYIPTGNYAIPVDSVTLFTPGANTLIYGDGDGSVLEFDLQDTTTRTFFAIDNAGVTFKDLKVDVTTSVIGATVIGWNWGANDLSFDNVTLDGGVVGDIAASHLFQTIKCATTGTFARLDIRDCYWHDVTRCWLRVNTDTSNITGIKITDCTFANSESSMFAFNAPNGTIRDVVITGNNFLDPFIDTVQADSFFIGPQVINCTISGNVFKGTANEAIHIEEKAFNITIVGNSMNLDAAAAAITVTDNNVSGVTTSPSKVVIADNVIKRSDSGKVGNGVELINNGGDEPVNFCTITGNVISGWEYGILNGAEQDDSIVASGNIIEDCTAGLRTVFGMSNFRDNVVSGNVTGIVTASGGAMIGHNSYHVNNTNFDPGTGDTLTLLGATFMYDRTDFTATGNTLFGMFPIGSSARADGFANAHAFHTDANEDVQRTEINWDGATLTQTSKISVSGGVLTITFVDNGGILALQVANSGAILTNGSVYCNFDGLIVVV